MSESIFFYDPKVFAAYQDCSCRNSRMVDDITFEQSPVVDDKVKFKITSRPVVCSACKKPYKVMVDTRRVGIITNLAD